MPVKRNLGELSADLTFDTSKAQQGAKKFTESIQKTDAGLMQLGQMAISAAAKVTAAFDDMIQATAKQANAERALEIATRGREKAFNVEALKAQASALQQVGVYGDEATIKMQAMLARFAENGTQIAKLTPLVQDLGAAMGGGEGSLQTSAMAVGRALAGQADGLSRYGVVLSDAEKKAFRFMTAQERVEVVSKKLTQAVGGMNEALAQTGAGAMTRFSNAVGDLKETMGGLLDQDYASWFGGLTTWVQRLDAWVKGLDEHTKSIVGSIAGWGGALLTATAAAAGLALILPQMVAGFAMMLPVVGSVALQLGAVGIAAYAAKKAWDNMSAGFKDGIVNAALAVFQALHQIINALLAPWRLLGEMMTKIGEMSGNQKMLQIGETLKQVKVEFDTTMQAFGVDADAAGVNAGQQLVNGMKNKIKDLSAELGLDKLFSGFGKLPQAPNYGAGGGTGSTSAGGAQSAAISLAAPMISGLKKFSDATRDNTVQLEIAANKQARLNDEYALATKSLHDWIREGLGKLFGGGAGGAVADNMANAITSGSGFGSALGSAIGLAAGGPLGVSVGSTIGAIGDKIGEGFADLMHAMAPSLTDTVGGPLTIALVGMLTSIAPFFAEIAALSLAANAIAQTEAVAKTQKMFEDLNTKLVAAFEPLAERLIPLAVVAVDLLGNWIDRLSRFMDRFDFLGNALYRAWTMFAALAVAMQHFRISVLDMRIGFQKWLIEMGLTDHTAVDELINARYQEVIALNRLTDGYSEMMTAADGASESLNSLNSSATNIPSGYKTNASIFSAQNTVNVYVTTGNQAIAADIGEGVSAALSGMMQNWAAKA